MYYILPDKDIQSLVSKGVINLLADVDIEDLIQPASLDIPVGDKVYLLDQKFLPFKKNVKNYINKYAVKEFDIKDSSLVLFKGQTYLVPVGNFKLPAEIMGRLSPKSSIGRIDVLVRGIFDKVGMYDVIPKGSKGSLWLEIIPQSFNIEIKSGIALTQIMFFARGSSLATDHFLLDQAWELLKEELDGFEDKLVFKIDLGGEIVGYKAINTNKVIDLTKKDFYNPVDFFKKVSLDPDTGDGKKISLKAGDFYIFVTKEKINVPGNIALEWLPFSHMLGELRIHYAGFFDPGFNAQGVMEVRARENTKLYDGQPVGMLQAYAMKSSPQKLYGQKDNNYQGQRGPKLAKFFKS